VARNDTDEEDSSIVILELMMENKNREPADPKAEMAMVPFLPRLVSMRYEAI
jgi:hypothetical protein